MFPVCMISCKTAKDDYVTHIAQRRNIGIFAIILDVYNV